MVLSAEPAGCRLFALYVVGWAVWPWPLPSATPLPPRSAWEDWLLAGLAVAGYTLSAVGSIATALGRFIGLRPVGLCRRDQRLEFS